MFSAVSTQCIERAIATDDDHLTDAATLEIFVGLLAELDVEKSFRTRRAEKSAPAVENARAAFAIRFENLIVDQTTQSVIHQVRDKSLLAGEFDAAFDCWIHAGAITA
jgi:hypothetical protein